MLQHSIDRVNYQIFNRVQQVFELDERPFGFHVRVLGQVASGSWRLGSVRLSDAEDVAKSRTSRLQIQLRRLGQIGLFAEVVQLEQRWAALYLSLNQSGREALIVASREEMISEALSNDWSQTQYFRSLKF